MSLIDNSREIGGPLVEIRKVQALVGERSFVTVLPKSLATELGIRKGDISSALWTEVVW